MSATDEEIQYVHDNEMDHVTYTLIMLRYVCLCSFLASTLESGGWEAYKLILHPYNPSHIIFH